MTNFHKSPTSIQAADSSGLEEMKRAILWDQGDRGSSTWPPGTKSARPTNTVSKQQLGFVIGIVSTSVFRNANLYTLAERTYHGTLVGEGRRGEAKTRPWKAELPKAAKSNIWAVWHEVRPCKGHLTRLLEPFA
jgi:hypothetical protein